MRHTKSLSSEKNIPDDVHRMGPIGKVYHLHKVMSGGIMMMELSFREQYFCVKFYVCESYRIGMPVNKHVSISTSCIQKNLVPFHYPTQTKFYCSGNNLFDTSLVMNHYNMNQNLMNTTFPSTSYAQNIY